MVLIARIVSVLFHPLLLSSYLFAIFAIALPAGLDPLKEDGHWNFVLLIFCVTFALPALNTFLFKAFGLIKSVTMESRTERLVPFSFITVLYFVVTYFFYARTRINFHDNLLKFLIIIDLLVLLATVITFFYKISVHSMAVWAFIGIILPLNKISEEGNLFYPTIVAIVFAGMIMAARLQLNAHTPREVMIGAITGLMISFGSMTLLF